jgi:RNA polymerase sigma-70 factor (ECF subfamily)
VIARAFQAAHGRVVSALLRRFGADQLARVENAVQEAGLRALERWRGAGAAGLEGWLVRVAHNALVDELRKGARHAPLSEDHDSGAPPPTPDLDDELCLIFLCCHPSLPRAAMIALTLRIAYGFDTAQIARAFLSDERTIAQRIVRAKQRLRDEGSRFELPEGDEVAARLPPILDVLYQLFTEGYATATSESGIDEALCNESLRLARLLTDGDRWSSPAAEALRALFCFHVARTAARREPTPAPRAGPLSLGPSPARRGLSASGALGTRRGSLPLSPGGRHRRLPRASGEPRDDRLGRDRRVIRHAA